MRSDALHFTPRAGAWGKGGEAGERGKVGKVGKNAETRPGLLHAGPGIVVDCHSPMTTIYLTTLGCRLNEAELGQWARAFQSRGHQIARAPQEAEVLVLNSCAVTTVAVQKSRQVINRLHRQNPSAHLVVAGCYAELAPDQVAVLMGVDLVVGNQDKEHLPQQVERALALPSMPALAAEPEGAHMYPGSRTRGFVKVQDGCRNRCAFCIVTIARGAERSRSIAAVTDEINALHAAGYQEAVLTGVHLGGYGSDLGSDLRTLVDHILRHTAIPRLRLSSLEPWDLPEDFFDLWQNPRLMPHLHLPLQSGSAATLRRMARRCSPARYRALAAQARAAIPDLTLTTDLIVGFPGENAAEWAETLVFVEEIGFGHIHIFAFSPRQGTAASRMSQQVRGEIKKERSQQLHAIAARHKTAHLAHFVGAARPVLWEIAAAAQEDGRVPWAGYTDNYLRVETAAPAGLDLQNRITPAQLIALAGHPAERLHAALPLPAPSLTQE